MAQAKANGITIEYEMSGPADAPVLLMIHGVGAQLIRWPQALIDRFHRAGFRTLRFDNRDIGLSTHMDSAPVPDIGSAEALKRAVLQAATISYSTGPSGVYLVGLFERWGIYEQIKPRIVQAPPGVPVGCLVARGEVELGFQQLSELINLPGITLVGPMPPELQSITTFTGAVSCASGQTGTATALLAFLASPQSAAVIVRQGLQPA